MAPSSGGPGSQPRQQHENRSGSNPIGENSRSTQQWKDVPRGTMDEVSSHVRLNLSFKLTTRPLQRLFYLILESHDGRCYGRRRGYCIPSGVERQPLKKLVVDESALLKLLHRWREEAEKAGRRIERIAVAFEAGRDGFWLARWLKARGTEAYVIHASSVAVSREHRRAKTDRLDTELLKRSFLGWLRGERDH